MNETELALVSTMKVLIDRITLLEARLANAELSIARLEVGHGIMPLINPPMPIMQLIPPLVPMVPIPGLPVRPPLFPQPNGHMPAYKCPGCNRDIPEGQYHTCISCYVNQDPHSQGE
jgi:hypothetical protein